MDTLKQIEVRAIDLERAGVSIAFINTGSPARKDTCKVNSNRIAAADDLDAALRGMIYIWTATCNANGWEPDHLIEYQRAVDAIAKAEGRS